MRPLRIGLDLDGVVYDYVDNTRQIAKQLWPEDAAIFEQPSTCWNYFRDDWGLNNDEFRELNQWGMRQGMLFTGPIVEGWAEVLRQLVKEGHSIHIVTHRSIPGVISVTDAWLREHDVPYSSITFVSDAGDKSYTDLDVLIDDKPENVQAWMDTGRHAIIYNQKWNEHYNGGAIRCFNPLHVVAAIHTVQSWIDAAEREAEVVAEAVAELPNLGEITAIYGIDTDLLTPETPLQEAQRLVHGDRGEDYGHPIEDFTRTGRIWAAILGLDEVTPEQVGLCMVGVKISREVNKPKRDNRVDGAGYFETVDMIHEYRRRGGVV